MRIGPLLAVAILLLTVNSARSAAPSSIPFVTIAQGDQSGIHVYTEAVARSTPEWRTLWLRHAAGSPRVQLAPAVDFSRDMVVAVFAGEVPDHTRVAILKIDQETSRLVALVQIASLQPGPVEAEPRSTAPFHIVRILRSPLPVVFLRAKVPDLYSPGR